MLRYLNRAAISLDLVVGGLGPVPLFVIEISHSHRLTYLALRR